MSHDPLNGARWRVDHGDALDVLRGLPDGCVDSVCCDPPYGLSSHDRHVPAILRAWLDGSDAADVAARLRGFMGREWDALPPSPVVWREVLRVLKPGGHCLAFGGTRTSHLVAIGLQLAGFEIRDAIEVSGLASAAHLLWTFGSGFPKGHNVSKAIDKEAGAVREGGVPYVSPGGVKPTDTLSGWGANGRRQTMLTAPATPEAAQWEGWDVALSPSQEPVIVARKPLAGTVAANVLEWGTGALNVDACRTGTEPVVSLRPVATSAGKVLGKFNGAPTETHAGRWPANLLLVHAPACTAAECVPGCAVRALDSQSGECDTSRNSGGAAWTDSVSSAGRHSSPAREPLPRATGASALGSVTGCLFASEASQTPSGDSQSATADGTDGGASPGLAVSTDRSKAAGCGRCTSAPSRTDGKSTTETETPATTTSRTSNACHPPSTTPCTTQSASHTGSSTGAKNDGASGATSGSRSTATPCGTPAPITATASHAPSPTCENGAPETQSTSRQNASGATTRSSFPHAVPRPNTPAVRTPHGPSRFFPSARYTDADLWPFRYVAKADTAQREMGLGSVRRKRGRRNDAQIVLVDVPETPIERENDHATVKPVEIMRWLVKLCCPPGGLILDPYCGSGTTGVAALAEGFRFLGIERDPVGPDDVQSVYIARARIAGTAARPLGYRPAPERARQEVLL